MQTDLWRSIGNRLRSPKFDGLHSLLIYRGLDRGRRHQERVWRDGSDTICHIEHERDTLSLGKEDSGMDNDVWTNEEGVD